MDGVLVGGDSGLELLDLGAQKKNLEIDGGVDCAMKQLVSSQEQNNAATDGKQKSEIAQEEGGFALLSMAATGKRQKMDSGR